MNEESAKSSEPEFDTRNVMSGCRLFEMHQVSRKEKDKQK